VTTARLFPANRCGQRLQLAICQIFERDIKIMRQQPTPRITLWRVPLICSRPKIALLVRIR
jgi:hypothetical protein